MGVIVDTSAWIDIERREGDPALILTSLGSEPLAIASISISELLVGGFRSNTEARQFRREQFVERVLALIPVASFDATVARTHARITAQLRALGQPVGAHDALIAATAISLDYAVLTHNARDFERVPGLVVRQPNW